MLSSGMMRKLPSVLVTEREVTSSLSRSIREMAFTEAELEEESSSDWGWVSSRAAAPPPMTTSTATMMIK